MLLARPTFHFPLVPILLPQLSQRFHIHIFDCFLKALQLREVGAATAPLPP